MIIKACGLKFEHLSFYIEYEEWVSLASNGGKGIGKTPEEAVAKLWLALNKIV